MRRICNSYFQPMNTHTCIYIYTTCIHTHTQRGGRGWEGNASIIKGSTFFSVLGSSPGPCMYQVRTLPLKYNPSLHKRQKLILIYSF